MIYAHEAIADHKSLTPFCEFCGEDDPSTCDDCGACLCEGEKCEVVHFETCSSSQYVP